MSYDIWKTIGSVQNCGFRCKKMRLFVYSFYVWGSTSVLTIVIVIIEFSPKIPDYFIKPGLNNGHCWFTSIHLAGEYIFFTGPMGIIIFFNILFFILSFIKARNIKRNLINHTNRQDSQRHDDNSQWFYLCFKLSIVTGICWSFEIISKIYLDIFEGHGWLWIIPDLFNTLQGLIIFIIFVCTGKPKKQILKIFFTTKNKLIQ
ncbi:G-protein coupled receptor Mth2-like [Aphidius gifuensis]|nr:G-protein coupled receptor Mth2-like [Aphidius gifuensis]